MDEDLHPITKAQSKKWFPKMSEYNNMVHLYLEIKNLEFDPDIISKKTNLEPYEIMKIGDKFKKRSGKEWICDYNSWTVKYEHNNLPYPDKAINEFIDKIINPNYEYFKEILQNASGKLEFVYYYHYSNNIGIGFEKNFIKILSDLNLEVDFDLYCLHEDE
jgi:hypothetical protein